MKACPFCKTRLRKYNYTSYYDPPEYGEICDDPKCGKYHSEYFYYDGISLKCGDWTYFEKYDETDSVDFKLLELRKRINYQLKKNNKKR